MSSIYSRYFRITSGPLLEAAKQLEEDNKARRTEMLAFCKEVGAASIYALRTGGFGGVSFAGVPDTSLWKKNRRDGLYWPSRARTAAALRERVANLPPVRPFSILLPLIQLHPHFPVFIEDRHGHISTIGGSAALGLLIVQVPWRDVDPAELEQYRQDKAKCTHNSMTLDHLLWTPTPEMVEIKKWEAERDLDELGERLKKLEAQAETNTDSAPEAQK